MVLRIILADDHPFVLLGIRAMLETHVGAVIVGEATSPLSLLARLQCMPCDLLITDLAMPDHSGAVSDGLDLIRKIRNGWPQLRIVVMTAVTNVAILRAIASDGDVSMVSKAESMDDLWKAIVAVRRGDIYLGRSIVAALAAPQSSECEKHPAARLSSMQAEVIRLLTTGRTIAETAAALGCHRHTVARKKREAMARLGVANDPGLFSYVRAYGIPNFKSHI